MIKLKNGATPLLLAGTPDEGVVLAEWEADDSYVVWHYWRVKETGSVICEWGHYFRRELEESYAEAAALFQTKAAEFLASHTELSFPNTRGEHGQ
jgi:hypothetical protein